MVHILKMSGMRERKDKSTASGRVAFPFANREEGRQREERNHYFTIRHVAFEMTVRNPSEDGQQAVVCASLKSRGQV